MTGHVSTYRSFSLRTYAKKKQRPACKDLVLDKDQTHGQVRKLDVDWVEKLQHGFEKDRPDELELTVWREQGVSPMSLLPLCRVFLCKTKRRNLSCGAISFVHEWTTFCVDTQ